MRDDDLEPTGHGASLGDTRLEATIEVSYRRFILLAVLAHQTAPTQPIGQKRKPIDVRGTTVREDACGRQS